MMQIISHRGFWISASEKNTKEAFVRTITEGFGTETDVRDLNGELVMCHDMPTDAQHLMSFDEFLSLFLSGAHGHLPLALNIKADGLQLKIAETIAKHNYKNYFAFDMSIPDTIGYMKRGLRFFTRVSEYEPVPAFYNESQGIWVDAFLDTWFEKQMIDRFLDDGKEVCFVSPDLHQRDHLPFWDMIKEAGWVSDQRVILCTDFPDKAKKYFSA